MKETLFCKDCKHCYRNFIDALLRVESYRCMHDESYSGGVINLVTGKKMGGRYMHCSSARMIAGHCRPEGKFWEPKNTKKFLFTLLKREV